MVRSKNSSDFHMNSNRTYIGLVHICPFFHQQLGHFGLTIDSSIVERGVAIILRGQI